MSVWLLLPAVPCRIYVHVAIKRFPLSPRFVFLILCVCFLVILWLSQTLHYINKLYLQDSVYDISGSVWREQDSSRPGKFLFSAYLSARELRINACAVKWEKAITTWLPEQMRYCFSPIELTLNGVQRGFMWLYCFVYNTWYVLVYFRGRVDWSGLPWVWRHIVHFWRFQGYCIVTGACEATSVCTI